MSFLGIGAAAQGRSRSRSRSRTRAKDDETGAQYQMSGANYTTAQPGTFSGVQFAKPLVPNFAKSSGTGSYGAAAGGAAPGAYQYAQPTGLKYTKKQVIHPSAITPIADIVNSQEEKQKKKKSKNKDADSSDSDSTKRLASKYQIMTMEPGKTSGKKKNKKSKDDSDDSDARRFADPYSARSSQKQNKKGQYNSDDSDVQRFRDRFASRDDPPYPEDDAYMNAAMRKKKTRDDSDDSLMQRSRDRMSARPDQRKIKSSKDDSDDSELQRFARRYSGRENPSYTTIERGKGSGKKKSKNNKQDDSDDSDARRFARRMSARDDPPYPSDDMYTGVPPRPSGYGVTAPGRYVVGAPDRMPISTPGSYPVNVTDDRPYTSRGRSYGDDTTIRDVAPRSYSPVKSKSKSSKSDMLSISGMASANRAPSPAGIRGRSGYLSVGGNEPHFGGGGTMPPPSPLLESYRGTYQSMPGLPSPMIVGRGRFDDLDIEDIEPLDAEPEKKKKDKSASKSSKSTGGSSGNTLAVMSVKRRDSSRNRSRSRSRVRSQSPKKKSVSMYAAEQDAKLISAELTRNKPDFRVLTDILPGLSHDQMLELRAAYKKAVKIQGKGIKLANHIKLKVDGNLCTVAYVTALGRWESEGYWANYWYQSASAKRELLIESLMGRTNFEMQMIKENFKDKRYGDSLVKCMDKELKADKFRTAAMLAIEAKRQEENEIFPPEYVEKDVETWYRAIKGRSGGETAMLEVCVNRSDLHLKKCLKLYDREHGGNFAKLALSRSENLVGEVLAHILNGIINRPARDAMLLHHALLDLKPQYKGREESSDESDEEDDRRGGMSKKDKEREKEKQKKKEKEDRKNRYELLISRIVRFHWDKTHLKKVKNEYRDKFDSYVEDDIEDWLKEGEFREFVLELLQAD